MLFMCAVISVLAPFSDIRCLFLSDVQKGFEFSTLLVACENPNLYVSQGKYGNGLWDAFLQLVFYGCGTQQLKTQSRLHRNQISYFQCNKYRFQLCLCKIVSTVPLEISTDFNNILR